MPVCRTPLIPTLLLGLCLLWPMDRAGATDLGAPGAGLAWLKAAGPLPIGAETAMPPVLFGLNETAPDAAAQQVLMALGELLGLAGAEGFALSIVGHTDDAGSDVLNQALSEARARSVAALIQAGLPADRALARLSVSGKGSAAPLPALAGSDPANRRVEIGLKRLALTHDTPPDWDLIHGAPSAAERLSFDGSGRGLSFPLPDERLARQSRGGVDLWMSPAWNQAPAYDPTLLSLTDDQGPRYSLHLLRDRGGLALWDGTEAGYYSIPYDFTGNRPYHLALVSIGDETHLFVDGERLPLALPLGFGPTPAERLTLGAGIDGLEPFAGQIGRVRLWSDALLADEVRTLGRLQDLPPLDDPRRGALAARTLYDTQRGRLQLAAVAPLATPADGWWAPLGRFDVRVHNRADYLAGLEPPLFSELQKTWHSALQGEQAELSSGTHVRQIVDAADSQFHPHFSLHHLFQIAFTPGLDPERYRVPPALRTPDAHDQQFRLGIYNRAMIIEVDGRGVATIGFGVCPSTHRVNGRVACIAGDDLGRDAARGRGATRKRQYFALFAKQEHLRGLRWSRSADGDLYDLTLYTSKQAIGPFAPAGDDIEISDRFEVFMPDGAPVWGYRVYSDAVSKRPVAMELIPDPGMLEPGVTVTSDAGDAVRFQRTGLDTFRSLVRQPTMLAEPDNTQPEFPVLTVLSPERITIDGIAEDILLLRDKPTAQPNVAFNDTFVSLSKAVNLQASYSGYDILTMDPLHLVDTGTHKPVFATPSGAARDYYDANRIFVPKGLFYTPEFTGKQHASVHTSETYAQFRDAHSETVSAGIGGKLAPVSFSMSARMSEAREQISEQKISKTLGLSKALFYDLVLDKQHMALSDAFVTEVLRLRDGGSYDAFIATFGSHYPVAVVYGGLGVLEIDFTEQMRQTLSQQGIGISMETSFLLDAETQTKASFGFSHDEEHQKTFRNLVGNQTENFYWIGGTHAGAEHASWSVGTDGVVPVHVALRPIDELLSPVWFDDPEINVRVRTELARAQQRRMDAARALLPVELPPDTYMIEARLDAVRCTTDTESSNLMAGQRLGGSIERKATKLFPMVFFSAETSNRLVFRNFEDLAAVGDERYQPIEISCPSHVNLMDESAYLGERRLARFRVELRDIAAGGARLLLFDRRDLEHVVLYPPPAEMSDAEAFGQGFLAGITLGIAVGIQEAVLEDGSPVVNAFKDRDDVPPMPVAVPKNPTLQSLFCARIASGRREGQCREIDRAHLDAIAGRWIKHSTISAAGACSYCVDRRIDYSVRVVK